MSAPRTQRGIGLFDALIALAILSFGMLAMSRFQARIVSSATDSQLRLTATALADELLNTAMVDGANGGGGSAACYTIPADPACPYPAAAARTLSWKQRVEASLPQAAASAAVNAANGQLAVTIGWDSKIHLGQNQAPDRRSVTVVTCINIGCTP